MEKTAKHKIVIDASDWRILKHPRKELSVIASEIQSKNSDFGKLFPKEGKPDLLYLQGVSFTLNHINNNDCLIVGEEGMESYKSIAESPLDIEHDRTQVVGFALKSFLSNIKNNKVLDEEAAWEILDSNGMVNVCGVWGIWTINNPELIDLINDNFDPHSQYFDAVKLSFEYYFDDHDFFISNGRADYPDGKIVSGDPIKNPKSEEMYKSLKIYKDDQKNIRGSGLWEGNRISIVPRNGFQGGAALTLNPANTFSDLLAKKDGKQITLKNGENGENDQKNDKNVEISKNIDKVCVNTNEVQIMDKDIKTDTQVVATVTTVAEPVKTVEPVKAVDAASPTTAPQLSVDKDLAVALQKSLDVKIEEIKAKDNEVASLRASVEKLQKTVEESQAMSKAVQAKYDEAMEKLNKVEAEKVEAAKKAKISERMSEVAKVMEISDDNKQLLESEAATLSDEDFAKKVAFYSKLTKKVDATETTTTSVKTTVQEAVTKAVEQTPKVDVVTATPAQTLVDQYKEAFGKPENFGFKVK